MSDTPQDLEREVRRLSVDCNALRLALRSGLPECLGCGKEFHTFVDAYRCTHCDGYLHKRCAEEHFGLVRAVPQPDEITLDRNEVQQLVQIIEAAERHAEIDWTAKPTENLPTMQREYIAKAVLRRAVLQEEALPLEAVTKGDLRAGAGDSR